MTNIERTLAFLKPDASSRKYIGAKILQDFMEHPDFKIIGYKNIQITIEHAEEHYGELKGKSYYPGLLKFITLSNVLALILEGEGVIQKFRTYLGATLVENAEKDTIRGKYGIYAGINLVHASDGLKTADRELDLWKDKINLMPSDDANNKINEYVNKWIKNEVNETDNLRKLCLELAANENKKDEIEAKLIENLKKECVELKIDKIKELVSIIIENILSQD